jgi:hypothetical protein
MGEFGRRRVKEELAWEYSVQNLLAAYARAFGKRDGGAPISRDRSTSNSESLPRDID